MLWDSWLNVWRGRSLPKRRRVASGSSLKRAADVAGAWSNQPIESLEDRKLLSAGDGVLDAVIDGDGKLVTVGDVISRYNPGGSLDTDFGNRGTQTSFGDTEGVAIDSAGRILVVGAYNGNDFGLARYNSDGTLDVSFGDNGRVVTDFGSSIERASDVAIDSDGKIVVAGSSAYQFAVARYNSDGTPDTSFGGTGKFKLPKGPAGVHEGAQAVVVDESNRIIVGGTYGVGATRYQFALVRLNVDGSLDTSFGNSGIARANFSGISSLRDLAMDESGRLIAVGIAGSDTRLDFAVARYTADGLPDGGAKTDFQSGIDEARGVTIDAHGRIVVVGRTDHGGSRRNDFAIARYDSDFLLDPSFGTGGQIISGTGGGPTFYRSSWGANTVVVEDDGDIIVAGAGSSGSVIQHYDGGPSTDITVVANDRTKLEGDTTQFLFTVKRTGDVSGIGSVDFLVAGSGIEPANADDFGGSFPAGQLIFAEGERSKTIAITVIGDTTVEGDETFSVSISNAGEGVGISRPSATATILTDDFIDLIYSAISSVSVTTVTGGRLQVTLDGVLQPEVEPSAVRSLAITGGINNDSIDLSSLSRGAYYNLTSIVLVGGEGNDMIVGSAFNDVISGGVGNDWLSGGRGNDSIAGNDGDDTLDGANDNDILSGGMGDDSLTGAGGLDRLVEEIAAPSDPAVVSVVKVARTDIKANYTMSGLGSDTIADIEEMSLAGSAGKDKIDVRKFHGSVTLSGNGGNDTLIGGGGNDSLDGGEGNDKLTGNGGTNQLDGGNGTDWVIEAAATNFVLTPNTLTGLGNETLNSVERASLTTANTNSRIDATAFRGVTILTGGSGNDTLLGGAGKDSISGGAGNDTLVGGNATDTLDGGTGDDALTGQNGHDLLFGDDGQDTLIGGAGRDTLTGGLNDDLLIGGIGQDSLDGEAGNDTGLSGQGGAARGGNGLPGISDSLINIEVIDEEWAELFAWE